MNKRIISAALSLSIAAGMCGGFSVTAFAEAKTPAYQETARQMEELNRGLIAVKTEADTRGQTVNGVYLSWRLLGKESLENQAFDIYRGTSENGNFTKIKTTGAHDATCYIDTAGTANNYYKVVPAGAAEEDVATEKAVKAYPNNYYAKPSEVGSGNSLKNSFTYVDIPIVRPDDVERMGDGKKSHYYYVDKDHDGGANDASVGDLDGDGDYEIVLKWDSTDSKDSAGADFTGNVYIDAYEIDPDNDGYKWRIDLGKNVTAGAHYTQFMVYDFDGDGCAEVAMKTAPGSIDGTGHYVSEVGDTAAIRNVDNEKQFIGTSGRLKGKNPYTQYLTIFDGETGAAMYTTEFIPYETAEAKDWGDGGMKYNRSERYLAGVAYLDGVTPSLIMVRGYYNDTVIRAYNWDGGQLKMLWEHVGKKSAKDTTLYGQGNHNLSIGDIDNDGKDEIVFGSASLDEDGKTVLGNTKLGHGDAMHMNDFNNDGVQEVFSVKEDGEGFTKQAENLRVANTGKSFWKDGKLVTSGDNGRGVMANIDDEYAKTHSNALAIGWSSGFSNAHDMNGDDLKAKPSKAGSGSFDNSLVYWDGDLSRELLDDNIIQKYDAENGWSKRFYGPSDGYTLTGSSTNNYTKRNACLSADLWGDWREEIIMSTGKGQNDKPALRIFTSTMPTTYRLTTLMHDSQYRMGIAWQNVAYNQPPHTSYYIGSAALAADESGNTLNYLAPAVAYTKVKYPSDDMIHVTDLQLSESSLRIERGRSAEITASVLPEDAKRKGIKWTTSDESVAIATDGKITAVSPGTATITATTVDGGISKTCEVEVWSEPVTGISMSDRVVHINMNKEPTKKLTAEVTPSNASDPSVIWESSNKEVATVSKDGTVTGISEGVATIYATTADGGFEAACVVNVLLGLEDQTGEEKFVADTALNSTTKFTGDATNGYLEQKEASEGASFHKDFTPYSDDKTVLQFHVTTGGTKIDGSNWNWTGHEYTMGISILDTNGGNILTVTQPYQEKAGNMTSKIGSESAKTFSSEWSGDMGDIQGSTKRWIVELEFDYANDTCNATITGTDGTWETVNGKKTKSFSLGGASFKTLKCFTTKDSTGTITASPKIEAVKYYRPAAEVVEVTPKYPVKFVNDDDTVVQESDVEVWTMPTAPETNPTKEQDDKYTYEFSGWYPSLTEVIDKAVYKAQYNKTPRTYAITLNKNGGILSDGDVTSYTYGTEVTLPLPSKRDYTFGGWYDNSDFTGTAITKISAEDTDDKTYYAKWTSETSGIIVSDVEDEKAVIDVVVISDKLDKAHIVGALYDGDELKEVATADISNMVSGTQYSRPLTFTNNVDDYTLRVFVWDSLGTMTPLIDRYEERIKVN